MLGTSAQSSEYKNRLENYGISTIFIGLIRYGPTNNRVNGTDMGSGLFLVSKKHYLPETIRNIQREQKTKYTMPIL